MFTTTSITTSFSERVFLDLAKKVIQKTKTGKEEEVERFSSLADELDSKDRLEKEFEDPPAPFIFTFPYPKSPPTASGTLIPKRIEEVCPKCGTMNKKKSRNCLKCGASLIPFS